MYFLKLMSHFPLYVNYTFHYNHFFVSLKRTAKDMMLHKWLVLLAFRFSEVVSAQHQNNNPNVADLSDQYRPNTLAEMFSELYDNQWTDAYTALEANFTDRKIVSFLLDVVMASTCFTNLVHFPPVKYLFHQFSTFSAS